MREAMQEASLLNMFDMQDDVAVASTAGRGDNVLVKGKRDEDNNDKEVDGGADSTHAFGNERLVSFGEVLALEAGLDEGGAQPADHAVGERKGEGRQGQGRDERLSLASEGVGEDDESGT